MNAIVSRGFGKVSASVRAGTAFAAACRGGVDIAVPLALFVAAYLGAYWLRFDFELPAERQRQFWETLPYLVVVRFGAFRWFRLHRAYWRHVGLRDLIDITAAASVGSVMFVCGLVLTGHGVGLPRSVLLLEWLLTIFLSGGARFVARCAWERHVPRLADAVGKRTLVVGAGSAGEELLRHLQHQRSRELCVVGLVDDDPSTWDMSLHGVPVLGGTDELRGLVDRHRADLLIIAIQHATGEDLRAVVRRCTDTGRETRILPSLAERLTETGQRQQTRKVRVEDLLGRQAVQTELTQVQDAIAGKVVLVTGAAGSIGSEIVRQVACFRPARLLLLEQGESALYFTHLEVAHAHPDIDIVPIVGDIRDRRRMDQVFADHTPHFVFHAAAYKHVPMLETNVYEAVRNNVFGTMNVAQAAARNGAERFVLISSDKAVNPSSVMGATKRIAERMLLAAAFRRDGETHIDFRAVRFGNVLGSEGSVVPLFERQMAAGQALTVTHPAMTRYFMTIPEAVHLVLQAAVLPEIAGQIAMLEMGEPVRILALAEQMVRLAGLEPYRDVPIVFTGLRPGEKLHEELTSDVEATAPTALEKVRVVRLRETDSAQLELGLTRLAGSVEAGDHAAVLAAIRALVPEYVRPGETRPPAREVEVRIALVPGRADSADAVVQQGNGNGNGHASAARTGANRAARAAPR